MPQEMSICRASTLFRPVEHNERKMYHMSRTGKRRHITDQTDVPRRTCSRIRVCNYVGNCRFSTISNGNRKLILIRFRLQITANTGFMEN